MSWSEVFPPGTEITVNFPTAEPADGEVVKSTRRNGRPGYAILFLDESASPWVPKKWVVARAQTRMEVS